jgi:hypothetical protein
VYGSPAALPPARSFRRNATPRKAVGEGAARLAAGAIEVLVDDGVQSRVQALDASDRRIDELDRGHVAASHQRRLRRSVEVGEIFGHGGAVARPARGEKSVGSATSRSCCIPDDRLLRLAPPGTSACSRKERERWRESRRTSRFKGVPLQRTFIEHTDPTGVLSFG